MTDQTIDLSIKLETPRLILRPYTHADATMLFDMAQRNRQHLQRYESGNFLLQAETVAAMVDTITELQKLWDEQTWFVFGAFEKATGDFAAQIFIGKERSGVVDYAIGYFADVDHTGRGYVTVGVNAALRFVFERLGAHRASLHCDDTNVRSQRVAQRCGFRLEGHIRENNRSIGDLITGTMHFGLLRSEYVNSQATPDLSE